MFHKQWDVENEQVLLVVQPGVATGSGAGHVAHVLRDGGGAGGVGALTLPTKPSREPEATVFYADVVAPHIWHFATPAFKQLCQTKWQN